MTAMAIIEKCRERLKEIPEIAKEIVSDRGKCPC